MTTRRARGRWTTVLLEAMRTRGAVPLLWHFAEGFGRALEPVEQRAILRAANQLETAGEARLFKAWGRDRSGAMALQWWLIPVGKTPGDYGLREAKSGEGRHDGPAPAQGAAHGLDQDGTECPRCQRPAALLRVAGARTKLCRRCVAELINGWVEQTTAEQTSAEHTAAERTSAEQMAVEKGSA